METERLTLRVRRGSVRAARHWARERAHELAVPVSVIPLVELLTSELVANAVLHASGGDIDVRASVDGGSFRVSVTDGSDDLPIVRTTGPEVPGGQGLRLVERLATQWGVERSGSGGKTVWFSVPADEIGT